MSKPGEYEERYCLFLDLLGFKSHVEESVAKVKATSNSLSFLKLKAALSGITHGVGYKESVEISGKQRPSSRRVSQFSDSVVISYLKEELNGAGMGSMLWDAHRLQLRLIRHGIFLRGAISSGLLYHNESLVFGPAMNEAVQLEKLASYPRVIVDGQLLDDAWIPRPDRLTKSLGGERTFSSMLEVDLDGLYFIDYFNVTPEDFGDDGDDLREYLVALRNHIKLLANKRTPSVKVKHSWLRTKFNKMASGFEKSAYKELGYYTVPEEDIHLFSEIKPFRDGR